MKLRNKRTGDVWEFDAISMKILDSTKEKLKARGWSGSCFATSLAELNEEWEDYKPVEPLIKDEKIRKAVRAWAEVNIIHQVEFKYIAGTGSIFKEGICGVEIGFYGDLKLTNRETYTIDELCGEEKE